MKTAKQFLEHYFPEIKESQFGFMRDSVYKAMREYASYKSEDEYEKGYQECKRQYENS